MRALTISLRFLRQKASARPRGPENACLYTSLRMPHETLLDTLPSRSTAICLKDAHVSTSHCDHLGRSKEAQIEPVEFHRNDGWLASTMREAPSKKREALVPGSARWLDSATHRICASPPFSVRVRPSLSLPEQPDLFTLPEAPALLAAMWLRIQASRRVAKKRRKEEGETRRRARRVGRRIWKGKRKVCAALTFSKKR